MTFVINSNPPEMFIEMLASFIENDQLQRCILNLIIYVSSFLQIINLYAHLRCFI